MAVFLTTFGCQAAGLAFYPRNKPNLTEIGSFDNTMNLLLKMLLLFLGSNVTSVKDEDNTHLEKGKRP